MDKWKVMPKLSVSVCVAMLDLQENHATLCLFLFP